MPSGGGNQHKAEVKAALKQNMPKEKYFSSRKESEGNMFLTERSIKGKHVLLKCLQGPQGKGSQ